MDFIINIVLAALVAGGISYFFNTRFERYQRTFEWRREQYTKLIHTLSGFYSTATPEERKDAMEKTVKLYREFQIWASDSVLLRLRELLDAMMEKNTQKGDEVYKQLVLSIRKDLIGRNSIAPKDLSVLGRLIDE